MGIREKKPLFLGVKATAVGWETGGLRRSLRFRVRYHLPASRKSKWYVVIHIIKARRNSLRLIWF